MIVSPDFLDHWKTRMLTDLLNDPCAPLYVIRLWAHCQNRKTHRLPAGNPAVTKAICRAPHDAEIFHGAMMTAGFIKELDGDTVAHEWDEVNAYLINSWENGKKGGRPKKKTQTKPTGYPKLTQSEPIREEKIRVEKSGVVGMKISDADAAMIEEVLNCRPEFAKVKPEAIYRAIHEARSNPRLKENHAEFVSDMANSLKPPTIPAKLYASYLQSSGKAKPNRAQLLRKIQEVKSC